MCSVTCKITVNSPWKTSSNNHKWNSLRITSLSSCRKKSWGWEGWGGQCLSTYLCSEIWIFYLFHWFEALVLSSLHVSMLEILGFLSWPERRESLQSREWVKNPKTKTKLLVLCCPCSIFKSAGESISWVSVRVSWVDMIYIWKVEKK